jgi:cytochrome c oxidase subunit I+III
VTDTLDVAAGGEVDSAGAGPPLEEVWRDSPGIAGFITTTDHKRVGRRYLVTAFVFLLVGGIEAIVMRTQLASPDGGVVDADTYNALMTMHGTTMIFLFNTPVFAGFGNYLVPLQIGARDMAFPRLNALSYWIFLLSGVFIYSSFLVGDLPRGGWFAYVPLSDGRYLPGNGMDFWAIGQVFLGLSTTVGAVNFVVTILRMRTPGMSLARMPLFVWGILAMSFMIIFAVPSVTLAGVLLELQRMGMHFFTAPLGGDPILYQHLFWIWGHPEVYLLFIPATGIISMVIPTFCRRQIVGYRLVVASLATTAFISFGLWVHHMFAADLPALVASFFSAASLIIAIPSGIQVFAWITTIMVARSRPRFEPPMLWALAFIVTFVLGGFSGVMVAIVPFDLQVHDSYFVVAHFHYVLMGGTVFPTFAGLHYWFPKMTGRLLNRRAALVSFWLVFVGFHVTFFPQHILGLAGMPRRIYWYDGYPEWGGLNRVSTAGAYVIAAGMAVMALNFLIARRRGAPAPADPWGGQSLEWTVSSPPPDHNFEAFPVVTNHHPGRDAAEGRVLTHLTELDGEDLTRADEGEHRTLLSSPVDAAEVEVTSMPSPSYWPLVLALGLLGLSYGVLSRSILLGGAAVAVVAVALLQWQRETSW